jgi:hypothetical protein
MYRWLHGEIPYMIDPNLTNQGRVTSAILHWEQQNITMSNLGCDKN